MGNKNIFKCYCALDTSNILENCFQMLLNLRKLEQCSLLSNAYLTLTQREKACILAPEPENESIQEQNHRRTCMAYDCNAFFDG